MNVFFSYPKHCHGIQTKRLWDTRPLIGPEKERSSDCTKVIFSGAMVMALPRGTKGWNKHKKVLMKIFFLVIDLRLNTHLRRFLIYLDIKVAFVCLYILYVCKYACVCTDMYVCTGICMHVCIYIRTYVRNHVCLYTSLYVYMHIRMDGWMNVCM